MLTYLSSFFSGDVDPTWPHVILLSVTVLASFAVAAGIIFESPKYSESIHRAATRLVIGGVAVEAVCTIFLFVFDEGISNAQQSKIIALETQIAPRSLTKEQYDAIQTLKGRVPAINLAVEVDSECVSFAGLLASALMNAGIKVRGYSLPPDMHFSAGLVVYDQHMLSDDNAAGKIIFDAVSNGGLTARSKLNRLPDALDMPREVPAILVYEKLYNVPGSVGPYLGEPADHANPAHAK